MSTSPLQWHGALYAEQEDRAFHKLLAGLFIPLMAAAIVLGMMKLQAVVKADTAYVPPATVELLPSAEPEQAAQPAPTAEKVEQPAPAKEDKPEPVKQAAPKTQEKPKPIEQVQPKPVPVPVDPTIKARAEAQKSGVLAFADQLADLRSKGDVTNRQSLNPSVLASQGAAGSAAGASGGDGGRGAQAAAAAASGGIGGAGSDGVSSQQSGQDVGKRRTTTVKSPVGFGRDANKGKGDNLSKGRGGRSNDEIQLVFDRAQGSFYAMYLRALRENASLAGKVVISVTISPSGSVSAANIVSSELGDPELEAKIITKVRSLSFGAKEVGDFTYPNYRIKFQPPN